MVFFAQVLTWIIAVSECNGILLVVVVIVVEPDGRPGRRGGDGVHAPRPGDDLPIGDHPAGGCGEPPVLARLHGELIGWSQRDLWTHECFVTSGRPSHPPPSPEGHPSGRW